MKSVFKDLFKNLVAAIIIVYLLVNFIVMPCVVDGSSMYDTLKNNDFGYSFIISRKISINRFDIVVIRLGEEDSSRLLVKRVIGMPNETIEYKDNKLYINGEYMEENFLNDVFTADFKETLGEDEYFCLGDNRPVSRDSRFYGAFSDSQIVATHLLVLYPFADFGFKK